MAGWITIRGTHVYVGDDETVEEAFERTTGESLGKAQNKDVNSNIRKEVEHSRIEKNHIAWGVKPKLELKGKEVVIERHDGYVNVRSKDGTIFERFNPVGAYDDKDILKVAERLMDERQTEKNHKTSQFEIIQKYNPMNDDYHTGIRNADDILTLQEVFDNMARGEELYPDFTKNDAEDALEKGKIKIYSSKPIGQGGFVTPSKMNAQDYAGSGKVYSKLVDIKDVAWIDESEGQYAKVD